METYGEPPYADASTTNHSLCPTSGKWEGHFENIAANPGRPAGRQSKKKKARDNRIREMFYLFFNSTPPKYAREVFVDTDSTIEANNLLDEARVDEKRKEGETKEEEEEVEPENLLPKDFVHVRGYGTNRFGTFEIVGSLNPATGTLQCQRMYVPVPTALEIAKATGTSRRSSGGRFLSGLDLTIPGDDEEGRARRSAGRKRKSSWKKRDMDAGFEKYEMGPDGPILPPGATIQAGGPNSGSIDIASIVKTSSLCTRASASRWRASSSTVARTSASTTRPSAC